MKKKILGAAIIAAIAVTAGWNFNQSKNEVEITDLALVNVEALASGESGCPNGCISNGNGCFCNMWHPVYAEYN